MAIGSKIDVHTVLKLIDDAITATSASSGASSGIAHLVDVDRLARVLVLGGNSLEHLGLVGAHDGGPERLGNFEGGELVGGSPVDDRGTDGINLGHGSGK